MNEIRTRFAPSPTGYLHVGSLRTALFTYLTAKSLKGKVILRIEDTDQKRYVPGSVEKLIEILDWVGIKFDEGPHLGGDYGPYTQSERKSIYDKYLKILLEKNEAYYCFCDEERLTKMREDQQINKQPPRYDRCCRGLSEENVNLKIATGEKFVIRQKLPLTGEIIVHDELRGDIKFNAEDLDDQVLIKSDGMPTYHFALIVDDHLMEITHVIRGEEWIPSFPKNILLYNSFGWRPPKFFHMPLTLNKGGGKLSKRQGDVAVEDYKAKGYLKEAILNFCVLLGWHPRDNQEIFNLDELEKIFSIEDMGTSPAVFDIEKLDYLNGYYIRQMELKKLTEMCVPYLIEAGLIEESQKFLPSANKTQTQSLKIKNSQEIIEFDYLMKIIGLEQERLKKLNEIGEMTEFFFKNNLEYEAPTLIWKKIDQNQAKINLDKIYEILFNIKEDDWNLTFIENILMNFLKENNLKAGDYLWPMRAALTGRLASPGPFAVADILGKTKSLKRINEAIIKLS
jgi:nondiscriminating glutamyl-tRNA synthetase